jgi:hypothetical protein
MGRHQGGSARQKGHPPKLQADAKTLAVIFSWRSVNVRTTRSLRFGVCDEAFRAFLVTNERARAVAVRQGPWQGQY